MNPLEVPPQYAEVPEQDSATDKPQIPEPENPDAKSGPPKADEFQAFFARVVIRYLTDAFMAMAFRGIDEDLLSDREIERITLTDDERHVLAKPFAEFSVKSKFMRKHGRMIIASADSAESVQILVKWMFRVNRIAAKYRVREPRKQRNQWRSHTHVSSGQSTQAAANGHNPIIPGDLPPYIPSSGTG